VSDACSKHIGEERIEETIRDKVISKLTFYNTFEYVGHGSQVGDQSLEIGLWFVEKWGDNR